MIRKLLIAIVFTLICLPEMNAHDDSCETSAVEAPQKEKKSREQVFREIQEFKKKYLAQEMELTEDQQRPFSDLYDEMCVKKKDLMKTVKEAERKVKKNKDATEEDYQAVTEAWNFVRTRDAEIVEEYDAKFSKFLSQKQIFKMKSAEEKFRKKMEEMRHRNPKHKKK